ncbi:hypothetical protein BO86DRAFT_110770 [Aspergillus japonicus CBS 114.51]|uniref:Secreted protein n=1 Tax=Aspergillus japonicus CBS 114.51 TaxID=1448312 RepID=A0A8T8XE92_ASPJA|nr:hypothetical protein BO86DRAFT_110770 [Aspergillus japonicus CBS 114.51]RAH86455.1 hypothetical protein BO86DRAFT_110770 [Aspergillus japonicus CBS 114.51]
MTVRASSHLLQSLSASWLLATRTLASCCLLFRPQVARWTAEGAWHGDGGSRAGDTEESLCLSQDRPPTRPATSARIDGLLRSAKQDRGCLCRTLQAPANAFYITCNAY